MYLSAGRSGAAANKRGANLSFGFRKSHTSNTASDEGICCNDPRHHFPQPNPVHEGQDPCCPENSSSPLCEFIRNSRHGSFSWRERCSVLLQPKYSCKLNSWNMCILQLPASRFALLWTTARHWGRRFRSRLSRGASSVPLPKSFGAISRWPHRSAFHFLHQTTGVC